LDAKRDWGHAKDFVEMQWLMLQQEKPDDYVIATGVQYSIREFIDKAADALELEIRYEGTGIDEVAYVAAIGNIDKTPGLKVGQKIVAVDPKYFRPAEVETLLGDPSKAKNNLGWSPQITLDEMVDEMVECDLDEAKKYRLLKSHGYQLPVSQE
ncbi:MAG: GDP-mannose 4,6-dehydratase, partial [Planctomycetota bacterium]|nr:GDP-mannose 4,6-dehydratase [Planctomycetota bacterium]